MMWPQNYDPFGSPLISTLCAAAPVVAMLAGIGLFHLRAHVAALIGLTVAFVIAVFGFGMPASLAARAGALGAAYGLMPIGWIILNIIFLYQLANEHGHFAIVRDSVAQITDDCRLQLLLIAFCFGAFFEGAAGFGTPVAVTGAMLIGLGFSPLRASVLSLIANTAPVAFGALGTPIVTLAAVTGLPVGELSAMVGRQMMLFALIVPFWMLVAFCGVRRTLEVWPAALVVGATFSLVQLAVSNLHGPWLAAILSALASIGALIGLLHVWQPKNTMLIAETRRTEERAQVDPSQQPSSTPAAADVRLAWLPWLTLSVFVFLWGLPFVKQWLDSMVHVSIAVPGLDGVVHRVPPVVSKASPEAAVYSFNILSATGSAILAAAVMSGLLLRIRPRTMVRTYLRSLRIVAPSLLTIAAMLGLGYVTRFSGLDSTMGLAFARTGTLYPFFGTMLGWLGVAVTGSDTASNVLFGNLQRVTAEQLGLAPVLMAAANSAGGVMGKMIDAQSIVVASTATQWFGHEGRILRNVFLHSLALAFLMGIVVLVMAYA